MYIRVPNVPEHQLGTAVRPINLSVSGFGQPTRPLPEVTAVAFRNGHDGNKPDSDNCCAICFDIRLGVRQNATASNGMEMIFTLSGHRRGFEYDITRTVRASIWLRAAGVWSRRLRLPMGAPDDDEDRDECLEPWENRIFVVDVPGIRDRSGPLSRLPLPATHIPGIPVNATDLVFRHSFAEWVITRNKAEGIPWTPLRLPRRSDGTRPRHIYWHSIEWLTRDATGNWDMDKARSRIDRGSLSAATIDLPPA
jgi:hypothetical protein